MERSEHTVDLELLLVSGHKMTVRVDKREARELRGSTAEFIRVWSVDDDAWCHLKRAHIVYVLEPRQL